MKQILVNRVKQNIEVYDALQDYIDAVSRKFSPNVKLDNIQNLFLIFGGFLGFVLFVFVVDFSLDKQLQAIQRRTVGYRRRMNSFIN